MSDYIVSARKYRPSTFKSVVGQKALTSTLKNAIDTKRLAQAYLFCGPRGVGKTSCARIFAKTINCLNPTPDGEACGECESCKSIDRGNSFNIVELDAASNNGVDHIRQITEEVQVPPQVGDYRVFIIDEVHMLSSGAFNAFLKTLEEPPKYAIFILATTEKHKVIPTILSRCQIYDFKRITTADIVEHLQYVADTEGIKASADALNVIARKADGGMRDALSIFDQVAASSLGNITYESALANLNVLDYEFYFRLVEAFRAGDVGASLLIFNEILDRGFDAQFFINGLGAHIRDLMVAADARTSKLLEVAEDVVPKYTAQAQSLPLQWYFAAMRLINDTDCAYRTATNKQILVELMLIRLCQLLNPPTPPFDRIDNEPPLKMPAPVVTGPSHVEKQTVKVESQPAKNIEATKQATADQPVKKPAAVSMGETSTVKNEPGKTTPIAVSVAETPRPVPKKTTPSPTKTIRLSDLQQEYEREKEAQQSRRQPIDPEVLTQAWSEFTVLNHDKAMLAGAMRENFPKKVGEEEYTVTVGHPAQKQAMETHLSQLLKFLRDKVENDFLSLNILIADTSDIKKPMPSKELFKDIIKSNPSIADISRTLDIELI